MIRKHTRKKNIAFLLIFLSYYVYSSLRAYNETSKKLKSSMRDRVAVSSVGDFDTSDESTSRVITTPQEINKKPRNDDATQEFTKSTPTDTPHSPIWTNTSMERCVPTNAIGQLPQRLKAGEFRSDSAYPYIGKDIWAELVDNKRSFFLRRYEDGFPNMTSLREWIISRPYPVTLVMNNFMDGSFPSWSIDSSMEEESFIIELESILNETNLHALYVENLNHISDKTNYHKLKSLPKGLRWNFRNSWLFGESKRQQKKFYTSISSSPMETKKLFELNRTETVWVSTMCLSIMLKR